MTPFLIIGDDAAAYIRGKEKSAAEVTGVIMC
jgi:hypothetical protein